MSPVTLRPSLAPAVLLDRPSDNAPTKLRPCDRFRRPDVWGDLYRAEAADFLKALPTACASIVFLDPPFNLGKEYSAAHPRKQDRLPEADYERWMVAILDESVRVLADGGALYLYHLPYWGMRFGAYLSNRLLVRHWIAVAMKNGFVRGKHLYPAHYGLLYLTKGPPRAFSRPRIKPALCRICGITVKDYGGYKPIIDLKGLNLSDFWDDLSPVRHRKTKLRKQNQLPKLLTDRIVGISGVSGELFVDPFAGTGTGVLSAVEGGMRFKACDRVEANCALTARRLRAMSTSCPHSD